MWYWVGCSFVVYFSEILTILHQQNVVRKSAFLAFFVACRRCATFRGAPVDHPGWSILPQGQHEPQVTQDTVIRIFWTSKLSKRFWTFQVLVPHIYRYIYLHLMNMTTLCCFKFAWNREVRETVEIFWGPPCFGAVRWLCVWNSGAVFFFLCLCCFQHAMFFWWITRDNQYTARKIHEILQHHVFKCAFVELLIPCQFMIPVVCNLSSHKIRNKPATEPEVLEHDIRLLRQQVVPKHLGKITIADTYSGARCPTSCGQKCITSTTCKASVGNWVLWSWICGDGSVNFVVKWPHPKWIQTVLY